MKNIIITTFIKAHNYGAVLQAFALQNILAAMDNNVEFLDFKDESIEKHYKLFNFNNKSISSLAKSIIRSIILFPKNKKRYNSFLKFEQNQIRLMDKRYLSLETLKKDYPKSDVYITGSDQVWNSYITKGLSDVYTLNFGNETIKRISYAASIGNSELNESEIEDYKNKISKIDHISVREETAKVILSELLPDKKIDVVLDPTLLLTKEEWDERLKCLPVVKEKYILAYVVEKNDEYRKIVDYLSEITGYKVIHFEKRSKYKNVLKSAYTEGPLEFINLIKNAEYVIATSFHATVFSIIFNKKFWIVPHKTTGSRVTNLLDKFNISDRAIYTLEDFKDLDYTKEIKYNNVNEILKREQDKSKKWLLDAINY